MIKRYWQIRGYDSTKLIFERKINIGQMTENQVKMMIKALVAKAGLSFDEIVGACAKRGTKIHTCHLEVRRELPHLIFHCGSNPYFVVRAVEK